jgi:hypothetical protein
MNLLRAEHTHEAEMGHAEMSLIDRSADSITLAGGRRYIPKRGERSQRP